MYENRPASHEVMEYNYDRPFSVTLLAILLILGGGSLVVVQLITFASLSKFLAELGFSGVLIQVAIAFLGLLGIASGIGTFLGKKWGWWLAVFYFAYAISRNLTAIISIQDIISQVGAPENGAGSYYLKYGIRAVWNGLILWYLVRSEAVNSYFSTGDTPKWKAILVVFGIIALIYAFFNIFF
ncbi:hypothetical protein [Paenibacillus sp. NEAU-GSW1]|uniref:hypothetical protein n=1 Tax=Paenibacillus sp. NEAU-GSW1 TaxID=2682486 RepID=UPI0012E3157C|nr:hypothetical protein [Paenibacillus sp. NEAU-GSW1]MUT68592.1 hypothetical protein [Paenibacillus sp. NEAU-GSW1]